MIREIVNDMKDTMQRLNEIFNSEHMKHPTGAIYDINLQVLPSIDQVYFSYSYKNIIIDDNRRRPARC